MHRLAPVLLWIVTGCSSPEGGAPTSPSAPPPEGAAAPAGALVGAPPGAPGGGGAPGQAPAPDASAPPPGGTPTAPLAPPGFASLITDGKTITIRGTVTPASAVQVDFARVKMVDGKAQPEALDQVKATGGKFEVKAPATLDGEIWVTAMTADAKPGEAKGGMAAAPIKLAGKDVSVEIKLESGIDWMKKTPWYEDRGAPTPQPPPDGPGAPGAAGGPAPAGAAGAAPPGGPAGGVAPGAPTPASSAPAPAQKSP